MASRCSSFSLRDVPSRASRVPGMCRRSALVLVASASSFSGKNSRRIKQRFRCRCCRRRVHCLTTVQSCSPPSHVCVVDWPRTAASSSYFLVNRCCCCRFGSFSSSSWSLLVSDNLSLVPVFIVSFLQHGWIIRCSNCGFCAIYSKMPRARHASPNRWAWVMAVRSK